MSLCVVTGANGYSGSRIARRLLEEGHTVRTLTGHPDRPSPPGVEVAPYHFDDERALAATLEGASVLYNTFWMRFSARDDGYATAVDRCAGLFRAAAVAGVPRIVHLSVANPALDSRYPYFRAKARVEGVLRSGPMAWSIVRPALVFGVDAVMVNNLAWLLRRVPVLAVPGRGDFRIRPVFVDDLAELCVAVEAGVTVDAVGPERLTFPAFIRALADGVGSRARLIPLPAAAVRWGSAAIGWMVRDVLLTRDEFMSTTEGYADSEGPTTGTVAFTEWVSAHGRELGRQRMSELQRHFGGSIP